MKTLRQYGKVQVFGEETKTTQALKPVLISSSGLANPACTEHIARILTLDDLSV